MFRRTELLSTSCMSEWCFSLVFPYQMLQLNQALTSADLNAITRVRKLQADAGGAQVCAMC